MNHQKLWQLVCRGIDHMVKYPNSNKRPFSRGAATEVPDGLFTGHVRMSLIETIPGDIAFV